jgi:hypothetical protein
MSQFTIRLAGPIEDATAFAKEAVRQRLHSARTSQHPYFNTTGETGARLALYRNKAAEQDKEVLDIIDRLGGSASPSQVWRAVSKKWPITSCRRAMTNLTNAGKLVKTGEKRVGEFGRNEGVWKLATP